MSEENNSEMKLLPICSNCKDIRINGEWVGCKDSEVLYGAYIGLYTKKEQTHGICPPCAKELYPELFD